jgi:hypothetical protein
LSFRRFCFLFVNIHLLNRVYVFHALLLDTVGMVLERTPRFLFHVDFSCSPQLQVPLVKRQHTLLDVSRRAVAVDRAPDFCFLQRRETENFSV